MAYIVNCNINFFYETFFLIYTLVPILLYHSGYTQHSISVGSQIGFGLNIPAGDASLRTQSDAYSLRSNGLYSGGVLVQYLLGDIFGIETGILRSRQTYSKKSMVNSSIKNFLGWNYSIEIEYFQVPIQIVLKVNHPTNPSVNFKFTAGPILELYHVGFVVRNVNGKVNYQSTSTSDDAFNTNLLLGIRIGNKKGRYGRIDYGIEYKYSLEGSSTHKDREGSNYFTARFNMLSFNLYYYFLNRYL